MRNTMTFVASAVLLLTACGNTGDGSAPKRSISEALTDASVSVTIDVPSGLRTAPFDVARQLTVPPGFSVAVFARIPAARFLALTPDNRLLVSVPSSGKVEVVSATGSVSDLLTGLNGPHDLVFDANGGMTYLYVSEKNQIRRYVWSSGQPTNGQVIIANLPSASLPELMGAYGHELKNIALDAAHNLYVSIASATNASPSDLAATPKRGAIYRYNADGSGGRLFAQGIRNAEGLAIEPSTGALWVVVNNRDNIAYPFHSDFDGDGADDYGKVLQSYVDTHPPEEFIRVRDGGNYGWPFCNPNPDSGNQNMPFDRDVQNNADGSKLDCSTADRVNWGIHAHSAPLGLSFVPNAGSALPAGYAGSAVAGYHGCWNCSQPFGYKVAIFPFSSGAPTQEQTLATGFHGFGRPVDVVANAQGEIFISDDSAGAVYKMTYTPPSAQAVTKLTLVNASTGAAIAGYDPIPDNATLDLSQLGSSLAIRAYTNPATVGSVQFKLDGAVLRTESVSPYCINGDNGTQCSAWTIPTGMHTLVTTPYSSSGASGNAGTPLTVHFTASQGSAGPVCATVDEHQTATLSCPAAQVVKAIAFASYGTPTGTCGAFQASSCNATTSSSVVSQACLNQASCSVPAENTTFGDPCSGTFKRLYVQATCGAP